MKVKSHRTWSAWLSLALIFVAAGSARAQLPAGTNVNVNQFNFVHQIGSAVAVPVQTLQVINETEKPFTVTAQVSTPVAGPNWLTVNGAASTTGTTGQVSSFVSVGAVPGMLPAGVYIGNVRVTVEGVAPKDIPVYLRVSASPQVALTLPAVLMQGQAGSQVSQPIPVSSTSAAVPFSTTPTQYQGANGWLSITPASATSGTAGSTPTQVTLTANLTNVPAGLHYAVINFHSTGADPGDVSLPIILTVTQATVVSANPAALGFSFQASNLGATTNNKLINISASPNANLPYTATVSGDSRVSLAKTSTGPGTTVVTGTTPENIYVIVNPVGIAAGTTINASVNIATTSNSVNVPVTVSVTNAPLLVPGAESVSFNYSLGGVVPPTQSISLTSTAGELNFTVAEAEVSGGDWLTVSTNRSTTPANISVSANQARLLQLAAGTYTANITIASPAAAGPVSIPVTLTVSGTLGMLNVSTSSGNNTLTFAADLNGAAPGTQTVNVSSTDNSNQAFTIGIEPATASNWLLLSKRSDQTGTTGTFFTVGVSPSGVTAAGKYEADVVVTPTTPAGTTPLPQKVHVVFNVNATATITATPARVDATQAGNTVPAPVTVQLASPVTGLSFLASTEPPAPWLSVSPASGTLAATTPITLTFNSAELAAGKYETVLKITPAGAPEVRIPVVLTIANATLNVSQTAFPVSYVIGTPAPANLTVGLSSSNTPVTFTAAAASTGNWLTVSPASGTTGASGAPATNLTLSINPSGLAAGTHTGTVTITSPESVNSPQTVTVTLTVSAQANPVITRVENAARNEATLLSPGLFLAIKGTNLGPATPVNGKVTNGAFETTAGEVRVLFDGIPAPITYASATQVNVVAPFSLFGRTASRVQVENRGVRSEIAEYRVVDTAPGIFTQDSTGRGLGSILNQNLTVNTATNPARRGEYIVIYATGAGSMRPTPAEGAIVAGAVGDLPRPDAQVTVRINGQAVPAANIAYAGGAPGIIAGVLQINVRIPADLNIAGAAQVPVEIGLGGVASQSGVTVAVIP